MSYKFPVPIANAVINAPLGLQISTTAPDTVSISPGLCMDKDYSTNIFVDDTLTLKSDVVGYGGLDTGVLAAGLYHVFIVYDPIGKASPPVGAIYSLSATSPTIPNGYTVFKRIGVLLVEGAGPFTFVEMRSSVIGNLREYWIDTPIALLIGGTQTAFTTIIASSYLPTTAFKVVLDASFTPAAAGDLAYLRAKGSLATDGNVLLSGVVAAKAQVAQLICPLYTNSIDYKVTASGSLNLSISGFSEDIE